MSAKCFFSIYTLKKIKKSLLGCPEKYVDPCSGQPTLRSVVVFFWWEKSREWSWCVCGVRVKKELLTLKTRFNPREGKF